MNPFSLDHILSGSTLSLSLPRLHSQASTPTVACAPQNLPVPMDGSPARPSLVHPSLELSKNRCVSVHGREAARTWAWLELN